MDIDEIPFSKLQIGQDSHKEEPLEVMESLVLPPSTLATLEDTIKNTDEGLTEAEVKLQGRKKNSRCMTESMLVYLVIKKKVTQKLMN